MTTQRVTRNGRWSGLQGAEGDDVITIVDTVDVPIVLVRRDCTIACFNKAATDVLRLSPADVDRACRDVPVFAGLPRLEEQCTQAVAGVLCRADLRDGDKWFVVRISPYTTGTGRVTGTLLTFTNVTAFRASIDQAIYERECTKAILNTVADPLVVLSADQRIQSGNRAFYAMFGLCRDESQGVPLSELENGVFDLGIVRVQLNAMLGGDYAFQPVEVEVSTAKGQRTLLLDAHPVSFPGHSEQRVLMTLQDITARKVAEAAKEQRAEEALAKARSELARASRVTTLGVMTASVAHEVNQPLSGIIANASTSLRMLSTNPPNVDGARETVKRTIRDGERASEVITRLRGLFSKKDVVTEPVDLNDAIREVLALSLSELQRGRVVVRVELADNLPPLLGDRVQLQQVFLNLITNAVDSMSGVDDRPRELTVRSEREDGAGRGGGSARVSVQDTGVGFDPPAVDRLFEAFYSTKSGGMGIGLSVSRSIIERHRGRLWATPNEAHGATFTFSIPGERPPPIPRYDS